MIITESKSYNQIKKQLKKTDKIGIISCNTCVTKCHTGGEKVMETLSKKLKKNGFNIVNTDLIGIACDFDQFEKDELKGEVNIILACDAGAHNLKKIFPKKKLINGLITLGLGAFDHKGHLTLVKKFE